MTEPRSFPKSARVLTRREFLRLKDASKKLHSKHFLLLIEPREGAECRLGVTISTKVDKRAVQRNRLRRRIREVFRLNRQRIRGHFDIVIIARKNAALCTSQDVKREIFGALFHGGLLKASTT